MPVGLGAAAEAMRRILIERARSKGRQKRGGGMTRGDLDSGCAAVQSDPFDLLALDEALTRLTADEPRKSELVTLRFFGGISMVEAANVPRCSLATADATGCLPSHGGLRNLRMNPNAMNVWSPHNKI